MTSEQCGKGIAPRSLILTDEFLVEGWVSASKEGVVLFPPPIDILGKTNIF